MERELAMRYRTPEALGMAVTAAARRSGMDVGRAISGFYFHRLLCRVFSVPDSPFLLKGGQSMLARTPSARATRDIDLLSREADLGAALSELRELASLDLGDFVRFEFAGSKPIKAEDEYRSGLKVTFVPLLGARRLQPVSVDLVVDQIPCGEPELLTPADRIEVEGVPVFDYRVYPVANSIADKLCGIIETHGGRPSSRVKDLLDLLIYATNEDLHGDELCRWCRLEARVRGIHRVFHAGLPVSLRSGRIIAWQGDVNSLPGIGSAGLSKHAPRAGKPVCRRAHGKCLRILQLSSGEDGLSGYL